MSEVTSAVSPARLDRKTILILIGLALFSLGIYLAASALTYRVGFPLDDAWIHQTYARSLAGTGTWSFIPGRQSGGSTSPLWSAFLSIGFLLRLGPYIWTYLLGWVTLAALAILAETTMRRAIAGYRPRFPWIGLLFVFEWHLAWAAGSGMETLFYALIIAVVLFGILSGRKNWLVYGALAGAAVWVRPDGISLLGPLLLAIWLQGLDWQTRIRDSLKLAAGFLPFCLADLVFNRLIAGSWWPNTYYAKQAEYAVMQQIPILQRYADEWLPVVVGVGAVLIPGVILYIWKDIKKGSIALILPPVLWLAGFLGLYAWRLPVTYQHGRYIMPAMPVFFWLGAAGLVEFLLRRSSDRIFWVLRRAWVLSLVILLVIFWGVGARTYAVDVATIESEMVDTARWVAANTSPGSLVAVHDIGAMGYFGGHDIIDLAGLISPDVIPIIRDEPKLVGFLDQKNVKYLVVFPNWYAHLANGLQTVYLSPGKFAPEQGQPNMCVYLWQTK